MRSFPAVLAIVAIGSAALAHASGGAPTETQRLEAGRRIYQVQCASCHGERGEGAPAWQRPNEQGELPAPPHDASGHTWKHADGMLYRVVEQGWRDPFNRTERLTMPAFGGTLSPREIGAVIDYLKTMWTPKQRAFQRQESRDNPFPPKAR